MHNPSTDNAVEPQRASSAASSTRTINSTGHAVDPGTYLFTGLLGHNMVCSGALLAQHEYVLDDVNKWVDLARSGQPAGALSEATGGELTASARVRSSIELAVDLSKVTRPMVEPVVVIQEELPVAEDGKPQ
jgi:hypothetical protein